MVGCCPWGPRESGMTEQLNSSVMKPSYSSLHGSHSPGLGMAFCYMLDVEKLRNCCFFKK